MARAPSPDDLQRLAALAAELRAWSPQVDAGQFDGRGIVIAAGGSSMFTNAFVLIQVLRRTLGCRLPIEVWHFGPSEMSAAMKHLLIELDAEPVDAEPVIRRTGAAIRDGWQLKPFAMLWSRFAEVLLLDADQVPVVDPATCFEWPEYREAGALFWPDIVDLRASNPVWSGLGLEPQQVASIESGQVLVDKRRHLRALAATSRLNEAADLVYPMIYGDKDTFLAGWSLIGASFAMVPHRPFRDERVLTQRDFAGGALFQHRTGAKWRYGSVQHKVENFAHERACLAALAMLEQRWGGQVFNAPDRSMAAREAEAALIAGGALTLAVGGAETLELELLAFGEIGRGRALDRVNWWCDEAPEGISLNLARPEGVAYRFRQMDAGLWTGQRLRPPPERAGLSPAAIPAPAAPTSVPGLADALLATARFGQSRNEDAALVEALVLIARADPGVLARLRHIAQASSAERRPGLTQLVAEVEAATAGQRSNLNVDIDVLRVGYIRPSSDGRG